MKKYSFLKASEIVLIFFVILSGLTLGFFSGGFILNFKSVGFSVLATLQKGVYTVSNCVTGIFTSVRDISDLRKEYNILTQKLQDYEYLQRTNADIRKENERLREQLGFSIDFQYRNVSAQIIGRDGNNIFSGMTIDKGIRSGIKKGMPVVAIQNGTIGVVGKIVTVGMNSSIVMPVYDSNCHISARIQNTRDLGLVSGKGSQEQSLYLDYIRKRVLPEIHYGDIVVTSGENGNFMRDIQIGTISKISVTDAGTSLNIELAPSIDFSRLEVVFVVDQSAKNEKANTVETSSK